LHYNSRQLLLVLGWFSFVWRFVGWRPLSLWKHKFTNALLLKTCANLLTSPSPLRSRSLTGPRSVSWTHSSTSHICSPNPRNSTYLRAMMSLQTNPSAFSLMPKGRGPISHTPIALSRSLYIPRYTTLRCSGEFTTHVFCYMRSINQARAS